MGAASSRNLFKRDLFDEEQYQDLVNLFNNGRISDWEPFMSIPLLSNTLIQYLNTITKKQPLITEPTLTKLLAIKVSIRAHGAAKLYRNTLVGIYAGSFRTIQYLTKFLNTVTTVSTDNLFQLFRLSFFGSNSAFRSEKELKGLFTTLIIFQDIYTGSNLGDSAFLTDKQILMLKKQIYSPHQTQSKSKRSHNDQRPLKSAHKNSSSDNEDLHNYKNTSRHQIKRAPSPKRIIESDSSSSSEMKKRPKRNLQISSVLCLFEQVQKIIPKKYQIQRIVSEIVDILPESQTHKKDISDENDLDLSLFEIDKEEKVKSSSSSSVKEKITIKKIQKIISTSSDEEKIDVKQTIEEIPRKENLISLSSSDEEKVFTKKTIEIIPRKEILISSSSSDEEKIEINQNKEEIPQKENVISFSLSSDDEKVETKEEVPQKENVISLSSSSDDKPTKIPQKENLISVSSDEEKIEINQIKKEEIPQKENLISLSSSDNEKIETKQTKEVIPQKISSSSSDEEKPEIKQIKKEEIPQKENLISLSSSDEEKPEIKQIIKEEIPQKENLISLSSSDNEKVETKQTKEVIPQKISLSSSDGEKPEIKQIVKEEIPQKENLISLSSSDNEKIETKQTKEVIPQKISSSSSDGEKPEIKIPQKDNIISFSSDEEKIEINQTKEEEKEETPQHENVISLSSDGEKIEIKQTNDEKEEEIKPPKIEENSKSSSESSSEKVNDNSELISELEERYGMPQTANDNLVYNPDTVKTVRRSPRPANGRRPPTIPTLTKGVENVDEVVKILQNEFTNKGDEKAKKNGEKKHRKKKHHEAK
ncbi:hypothetical protein GPJ56_005662 [Histomonas meleagridis]|uniref:uncharacterized protein n=1 Tax=Histomonas meleagridis TaxID=135588 RepID=UPI00355AC45C|nr:hypothetical protein GPJ56_005662 [Histomonas meleagridis]KAH0803403.1 hypothetical protein GO595_003747 [Histomonas meleagridis]